MRCPWRIQADPPNGQLCIWAWSTRKMQSYRSGHQPTPVSLVPTQVRSSSHLVGLLPPTSRACLPSVATTKSTVCSRQMHPLEAKLWSFLSLDKKNLQWYPPPVSFSLAFHPSPSQSWVPVPLLSFSVFLICPHSSVGVPSLPLSFLHISTLCLLGSASAGFLSESSPIGP